MERYLSIFAVATLLLFLVGAVKALEIYPNSISLLANSTNNINLTLINNENKTILVSPAFYITIIKYPIIRNIQTNFSSLVLPPFSNKTIRLSIITSGYYINLPGFSINLTFMENGSLVNIPVFLSIIQGSPGYIVIKNISIPFTLQANKNYNASIYLVNFFNVPRIEFSISWYLLSPQNIVITGGSYLVNTSSEGVNIIKIPVHIPFLLAGSYYLKVNSSFAKSFAETEFSVRKIFNVSISKSAYSGIFGGKVIETITNYGNTFVPISPSNISEGYLTLFSGPPLLVINGTSAPLAKYYVGPGQSIQIEYVYNLTILYIIIGLIIAEILLYFFSTRYVSLHKEIVSYKFHNGNLEARVLIRLKNLSNREIRDIKLYDYLPKSAEVSGDSRMNIISEKDRIALKWNLGSLGKKEELLLEYSFKTKIGVFGELRLDRAKVEFALAGKEHKKVTRKSNSLILLIKE